MGFQSLAQVNALAGENSHDRYDVTFFSSFKVGTSNKRKVWGLVEVGPRSKPWTVKASAVAGHRLDLST